MTRTLIQAVLACFFISGLIGREATATIYTIDQSQSSLSFAMYIEGVPLSQPQFPGSDTTSLSGTVDADVSGSTITLISTNNILFANQAVPVAPGPGGGGESPGTTNILPDNPGSNTANYGIIFLLPENLADPFNVNTAYFGGYGNIQDEIVTIYGTSSIAGGLFNAATLNVGLVSAYLDWNINAKTNNSPPPIGYPLVVDGNSIEPHLGVNSGAGIGSLVGNELTIPVNVDVLVQLDQFLVNVVFTGQIVAHAVPEPATIIPASLGVLGLLAAACRGRKRTTLS